MDWDDDNHHGHGASDQDRIAAALERIANLLQRFIPSARALQILQITGGSMGQILGIQKGAVGNFTGLPLPAGSSLAAGSVPTWSADDPNVSLTPSADGSAVSVQTVASDPASSFNLTQNAVSSDGTNITSGPVNVPLLGTAPVPAKSMDITQIS
jgi:hypothetical protein